MAWTEPITWGNTVSAAADFNAQIRDNLLALKSPPGSLYQANEGSNYTINTGSYVNIDSDWSFTFDTNGGDLLIGLIASVAAVVTEGLLDVSIDGSRIANNTSGGVLLVRPGATSVSLLRWVRGLAAGSHTISLQWKILTVSGGNKMDMYAGAGTALFDLHPQFWVREVS